MSVCYVSYNYSWAGVRYFSPFLPFVYGYGIFNLLTLFDLSLKKINHYKVMAAVLSFVVLIIPVYYPHRYYERTLCRQRIENRDHHLRHAAILRGMLINDGCYLASSAVAGMAYQSPFHCISIHEYFDTSYVKLVLRTFNPGALALTTQDTGTVYVKNIVRVMQDYGYEVRLHDTFKKYCYYDCHKKFVTEYPVPTSPSIGTPEPMRPAISR